MCGFTIPFFGAPYPDALCIEGYLWDLDSDDGDGYLTSGGEFPCPRCNAATLIEHRLRTLPDDIPQNGEATPAEIWEDTLRACLQLAPQDTIRAVREAGAFCLLDIPGRIDSPERPDPDPDLADLIWRDWPWRVPGLSAHQAAALGTSRPDSAIIS